MSFNHSVGPTHSWRFQSYARDRSITHSLQRWVSTKSSISQLECIFIFYNKIKCTRYLLMSRFVSWYQRTSGRCQLPSFPVVSRIIVNNERAAWGTPAITTLLWYAIIAQISDYSNWPIRTRTNLAMQDVVLLVSRAPRYGLWLCARPSHKTGNSTHGYIKHNQGVRAHVW